MVGKKIALIKVKKVRRENINNKCTHQVVKQ
jgi:hypothetical protein